MKKKRTKDSLNSIDPPSSPTKETPISPTISKTISAGSGGQYGSSAPQTDNGFNSGSKATDSMQSAGYQQQYNPQQPQQNNAASIQHIINPPSQNDSAYSNGASNDSNKLQGFSQPATNAVRETKGKYTLTDFVIQRTLGTGSFGRVHLVQSKHNQRFYAVKVLKKAQVVKMKQVEHTNDERRMLQKVKHPFLITLWGTFQDSKNLYMVMDFIEGGELFSLLRKSQV